MDSGVSRSERDGDADQTEPENVVAWGSGVSDLVGAEELAGLLFAPGPAGRPWVRGATVMVPSSSATAVT